MSRERARRVSLAPAEETIEKIKKVAEEGNFYGAQQMYKSFGCRYASAYRYLEALDIFHSGACLQLANGQVTCGAELAVCFVEHLVKGNIPYGDDTLDRIRQIYKKFPRISVPQNLDLGDDVDMQQLAETLGAAKTRAEGCSTFLRAAIKWSTEFGGPRNGSPEIHDMLADYLYTESPELDMSRVTYHFVRGRNPKKFASTLVNFMGKCYPGEDDLAVARAVLMYLAQGNLRDAIVLMDEIKKQEQSQGVNIPQSDLMQFTSFLLETLQRDALPLFNMLLDRYRQSISRERLFNELLDEIAEKFYGVQRRNSMPGGMFGEIFKMMAGE
ncbi:protein GET4-like isoform X1 [Salvia splendens]|uniref:protein GET4-like isoform X1 n=1 Tax=Salvia splendens TaxID=180675 RepID=UPI001C27727C|nr:protein GET4-like isoform X1 [Salvia splendens]